MKKIFLVLLLFINISSFAQVGIGTTNPDGSSILELNSTTQGMLTPRMLQSERDAITSPATGLLIYQTDSTPGFYYYNGTAWVPFSGVDNDWTVSGNNIYNANTGNVGVGNTAPTAQFHVSGITIPASGGTVNLLDENFDGYTVIETNTSTGCTIDGWERTISGNANVNCSSCTGNWVYIDSDEIGCSQNSILDIPFTVTPSTTSINISFDYRFRAYGSSSLRIFLYNHTTTSFVGADLVNTTTDDDTTFTGTSTVTPGHLYSIGVRYIGSFAYGASIDNVLVTETSAPSAGSYVFRLEDGNQQIGYVLTSDANGNATWEAPSGGGTDNQTLSISGDQLTISNGNTVTIPTGGSGSNTANNGLSLSGSTIQLGGNLIKDTTINIGDNDFIINGNSTTGFTGEMTMNGNSRIIYETEVDEDYINFGGDAFVDGDNGQTFSDTYGGGPYTKDFVLGAHNGSSGGTAIALGSIEYIVDGTDELFYEGSALSPMSHLGADLGGDSFSGTSRWWDDVYADDFVTETATYPIVSGRGGVSTPKVKGLKELLLLNPVSYKEQVTLIGKTKIPDHLKEMKLGFHADQLVKVIPEAVKTSDWVALDESGKRTRIIKKNPKGIKMLQLIPVTVKAIQEQQEQIENLKSEVIQLKELVNKLLLEKK
ncbi:MAG: hypothetical protein ACPGU9_00470 [Flavobacteriaceae bacterium]